MNVNKGDILKRDGVTYEVVCADEDLFILGRRLGTATSLSSLEAYSNNEFVCSLEKLHFSKEEK